MNDGLWMMNYGLWNPDLGQEAKKPQQVPLFWRKAYVPIYQRQKIDQKGGAS
jgi:hypothetical protein